MMKITFRQIEVFVAIAKCGNMTTASQNLFLTQSACSMALSSLENQLGGALFDRHGKKLMLNERGRVLFPKAANLVSEIIELENLMIGKKEQALAGHLIVGASTTIGNYLLPKIINDFINQHAKTKITLNIANTEQIIQQLLNFEIDMGVIEGNCHADKIDVINWKKDNLIIVTSPKHPLAKSKKVTKEQLFNAQWILREPGSGTREKFEEAIHHKIKPFLEFGSTEAIKHALLSGSGISCLSKTVVMDLLKTKQLVEIKTPFLTLSRDFFLLLHHEKYKTTLLETFITSFL